MPTETFTIFRDNVLELHTRSLGCWCRPHVSIGYELTYVSHRRWWEWQVNV